MLSFPCASETELLSAAAALHAAAGRRGPEGGSPLPAEATAAAVAERLTDEIRAGGDPLGEAFCRLRTPALRRPLGATYTPQPIVRLMVDWAAGVREPARVVDPGTGSGRFLLEAGRRFPDAALVGMEVDPVAAALARANLAAAGFAARSEIVVRDFTRFRLPRVDGPTLFIGNPPYVRHHHLPPSAKAWLQARARSLGMRASQLSGLHVHFYLATALQAREGDFGAFITAAEWLDVNYGALVRQLFLGPLGGCALVVLEPTARPFPDAASTAAIALLDVRSRPTHIRVARSDRVETIERLGEGTPVPRSRFEAASRWSVLTRSAAVVPEGFIELGELCRVHRGAVTGANKVWIAGEHSADLPEHVLYPAVTRARELFAAGERIVDASGLRRVIDLPVDLDTLSKPDRRRVARFLALAKARGADRAYVARQRRAWWSVGLREPPPIMATYMARRPPAFVRNPAGARFINIAHGLYPREPLPSAILDALTRYLATAVSTASGRTYAGGLTKFEPREMERLPVPSLERLATGSIDG